MLGDVVWEEGDRAPGDREAEAGEWMEGWWCGLRERGRLRAVVGVGVVASSPDRELEAAALGVLVFMGGGREGGIVEEEEEVAFVLVKGEKLPGARFWDRVCCIVFFVSHSGVSFPQGVSWVPSVSFCLSLKEE